MAPWFGGRAPRLALGAGLLLLLTLITRDAAALVVPWWNTSYSSAREVTLTSGTAAIPAGTLVSITINHSALVAAGQSLSTGDDVRLVYNNAGTLTELPRVLASGSAWNSATTKLMFKTQTAIAASSSNANYLLYYGNPGAAAAPTAGVPTARFYKVEQLAEQTTTSAAFVNMPGTTLTFTPGDVTETWVVFATGVQRSSSTGNDSEMRLLINGVEEDAWGQQNNNAATPNGSGFLVFKAISGTTALQTLQMQFRSISGTNTTAASSVRLVACLLPQNADFQYSETDAATQLPKNTANAALQTLTFTPASAGDYCVFAKAVHNDPGGGTVNTWIQDDTGVLHPDAPAGTGYANKTPTRVNMGTAFRKTLPTSPRTFTIRGTTGGNNGSIWEYRRIMAFRADVWEAQEYNQSAGLTSNTNAAFLLKNSLTTAAPPAARDYLVVQVERMGGDNQNGLQKSGVFRDGGIEILRTNHHINLPDDTTNGYMHVAAVANVKNTAASVLYENGLQSSDPTADRVRAADSTIMAFRWLEPTVTQAPAVRDLSSTAANATYGLGASVPVTVRFSEPVTVTGVPQLTIETGAVDRVLNYTSGSGTNTLTFAYTVGINDTSPDLDVPSASALALSGGTIKDAAGFDANLLLPAPGTTGSLGANKALVIDGIAPGAPGTPAGTPSPNNGTFTVNWTGATDFGGAGTGGVTYTVQRALNGGSFATIVSSLAAVSLPQSGLGTGNYTYQVFATDLAGNIGPVSGVSAAVVVDATPPTLVSFTPNNPLTTNLATVSYTVTFSEAVTGVDAADFKLNTTGTIAGTSIGAVTGSGATWTVPINTGTGQGTIQLAMAGAWSISDTVGNALVGPFPAAPIYNVDHTFPVVSSIVRANPSPTNLASVAFTVTFSKAVSGVDASDFFLATSLGGAGITGVSAGPASVYTITVSTGGGSGNLQINLVDNNSIVDAVSNPLGGPALGDGDFTGVAYQIDKVAPTVSSIVRAGADPTNAASVGFTVTFSEAVSGVDATDFALATTGTIAGATVGVVSGGPTVYTVTVNTGTGSGSIGLNVVDNDSIADPATNLLGGAGAGNGNFTGQIYTIDRNMPLVSSIVRAGADPTSAASVGFTVTFSKSVTGVDSTDFALATSGVSGAGISGVSGSGTTYTVTVNTGTGNGSIGLNLVDNDSIIDALSNPLGGAGAGNGNFTGEVYTVDRIVPVVSSIVLANSTPTNLGSVGFTVTFSKQVSGVNAADFSLVTALAGAGITGVSAGPATVYTVTVSTGSGSGSLGLNLVDDNSIIDTAGNSLGGAALGDGNYTGPVYTVDKAAPTVSSIVLAGTSPTAASSVNFTVTFSEAVSGVDATDFALATTGTIAGATVGVVSGGPTVYTVTVNTGTGSGSIGLNLVDNDSIADTATNLLGGVGAGNGNFTGLIYTIDRNLPVVSSIVRAGANPTNSASAGFTVTFSKSVTGVDTTDFALVTTGVSGAGISGLSGSGTTYTVTVNTGTGDGTVGLNLVDNDSIIDSVSNPLGGVGAGNGSLTGQVYTVDHTAPTISTITASNPLTNNLASVAYTVTFSENVANVDSGDFTLVTSGVAGASITGVTGGPAIYTVTIGTGTGNGTIQLAVAGSPTVNDPSGNGLAGPFPAVPTYTIDKSTPTVSSLVLAGTSPTAASSVGFTVTFSEAVSGVDATDFALATTGTIAGASVGVVSGGPTVYTVTVNTGTGSGTIGLNLVDNDSIADAATNLLGGAGAGNGNFTGQIYTIDRNNPGVASIVRAGADPTNAASVGFTVTFTKSVTGVDSGDFALATTGVVGAGISGISGSGTTYTVTVNTGTGNGTIGLNLVDNDSIIDSVSNPLGGVGAGNGSFTGQVYTVDRTAPTITLITASNPLTNNLASVAYTVTFSENVANVDSGDFTLVTSGVTGASITGVTGGPSVYTVTIGTGAGSGTIQLAVAGSPTVNDPAGNALAGPFPAVQTYTIDRSAPTVSSLVLAGTSPTAASSVNFTVTFSEAVSGVDATDFALATTGTIAGATVGVVSGGPTVYTVTVNTGTGSGTIGLNLVDNDSIVDAVTNALGGAGAGNGNFTGQIYTIDRNMPVVSSIVRAGTNPTNAASVGFTVTFSKSVTGVDSGDFALVTTGVAGAGISGVSGSGTTYTVTVNTGTGDGTVGLNLVDNDSIIDSVSNPLGGVGAGNGNLTGQVYTVDHTAPTISTITTSNPLTNNLASVAYTVTFSENVANVDSGDFTLVTSGVAGASITGVTGGPAIYTVTIGTGTGNGTIQLAVAGSPTVNDPSGNGLAGPFPAVPTYTIDKSVPTVSSIVLGGTSPTAASSVTFTVTFSESVTGVDSGDFMLATTGVAGAGISGVSGSGATYTVTVNTGTGSGTIGLNLVDNDSIADAATNLLGGAGAGNGNFTGQVYTIDRNYPVVSSLVRAGTNPSNAAAVNYTVTFSKPVTGVDTGDFTLATSGVAGANISGVSGSGTTYTVTVNTGTGNGSIQLNLVDNDSIIDAVTNPLGGAGAGNGSFSGQAYLIDKTVPTVSSITLVDPSPSNQSVVHFSVTFSEPVTGVDAGDFALAITGGISGQSITTVGGSGATYTVTVNTGVGDGSIGLNLVDNDSIQDLATNALGGTGAGNGNFTGPAYSILKTAPTLVSIVKAGASPTNAASVNFTATFSGPVNNVDAADFALVATGVSGASIGTVTGSGAVYTVPVSTGSGDGTVQVNMAASPTITDAASNGIAGPFPAGEIYTIDKTPPGISISAPSTGSTGTGPVSYTITYTGASSVTLSSLDVQLNSTGGASGTVTVLGAGPSARTVTISAITGNGTLGISIVAGTAVDSAGNAAPAAGPSATFTVVVPGAPDLPTALQVEGATNPTAVTRGVPDFTAVHNWTGPLPLDAALFQIQVSTDPTFATLTHWNSPAGGTPFPGGATFAPGMRSPVVPYGTGGHQGGPVPLLSWNSTYAWRIKFWDTGLGTSGFSTEPATFHTDSPVTSVSANGNGDQGAYSWRYLGFPIAIGTTVPASEFLGHVSYVLKWDEPTRQYIQLTASDVIEGGRGYLAFAAPWDQMGLTQGTIATGDQPLDLTYTTLAAPAGPEITEGRPANYYRGAHFVCNPFNKSISWNDPPTGSVDKANLSTTYFKWDGYQYLVYNSATQQGSAGPTIAPFQAFGVNVLSSSAGADMTFRDVTATSVPKTATPSADAWGLQIVATSGAVQDTENYVGVFPAADDAWDPRDAEEPGHGATTWVLLSFDHSDWTTRPHIYTHDYRKSRYDAGEEVVWTATIETNTGLPVTLTWPNIYQMPSASWSYTIEDPVAGTTIDMLQASSIDIAAAGGVATVRIHALRTVSSKGSLSITKTLAGPAPASAVPGATGIPLLSIDLQALGEPVTVDQLTILHAGTGDPSMVLLSLFDANGKIAGPTPYTAGQVVWSGLGRTLAENEIQTWVIVADFDPAAVLASTYQVSMHAEDVGVQGGVSGKALTPAAATLSSSVVTMTASAPAGDSGGGGGGGGSCGLIGVEFLAVALVLGGIRRIRGGRGGRP